jgi:hypothetical protein
MSRICGGERLLGAREKEVLAGMLWQAAAFCGVQVLTFAVMSNHFHVLVFVPGKRVVDDAELVARYRALYGKSRAPFQPKPEVLEDDPGGRGRGGRGVAGAAAAADARCFGVYEDGETALQRLV